MTEKVKLTREQAEAIKLAVADYGSDVVMNEHYLAKWIGKLTSLNTMPQSILSRALLIGYEVKEEYKLSDWVRYWKTDCEAAIGRVVHINYESRLTHFDNCAKPRTIADITRHATPEEIKAEKERRTWAKIGREVGKFRDGDTGVTHTELIVRSLRMLSKSYESGNLKGFYPAESFVLFGGGEE